MIESIGLLLLSLVCFAAGLSITLAAAFISMLFVFA